MVFKLPHLGGHYLEVSKETVSELGGSVNCRLICTLNEKSSFQTGLVALGEGKAYIILNAKRMKLIDIKEGDTVDIILVIDNSKYGVEMPVELEEILRLDEEAFDRFEKLAPGKQRYLLQHIGKIKNVTKRIDRAIQIVENLKRLPSGKESFEGLLAKE